MIRPIGFIAALLMACAAMATNASDDPIPREYFGLHIHRADQGTAWPTVPFGSWRLWDSYVGWAQLEPAKGRWDFSRLDRYVAMANITKVDILLPLAMTPQWASARPHEPSAYKPGNIAEPANFADWSNYVSTVGTRYKGKIKHYEIWNEPSDKTHYSGDIESLVKLTCEAKRILKDIDPTIKVISPASAGGGRHIEYLNRFLATGGAKCIDIVGHHFYVFKDSPEAMIPLIRGVKKVMVSNGLGQLPLWNTETGYWIGNADGTIAPENFTRGGWKKLDPSKEAGEYITQAFLIARTEGIERFFWYAWDNRAMGLIEPTNGQMKPAATYWRTIATQLIGASQLKCTHNQRRSTCSFYTVENTPIEYSWESGGK